MRATLAATVTFLAIVGPAGAVSIPTALSFSKASQGKQDRSRSCQAGSRDKIILKQRHGQVVACEQPPKSNLLTPDQVAKATAAALQVLG